ncbi:reverse transcriptase domain-containing protein [Alicyclobacillus fastidiosus]|uniref:reverse transcriptase domain-containing protein n=1 Tax=Alicyclobacillus fastidiosus TaxID=392011 RepID=UPI003D667417
MGEAVSHIGTLVRYVDDFVILCRRKSQALKAIQVLKAVFRKLELTMNTDKSKLVNLWGLKRNSTFSDSTTADCQHLKRRGILRHAQFSIQEIDEEDAGKGKRNHWTTLSSLLVS